MKFSSRIFPFWLLNHPYERLFIAIPCLVLLFVLYDRLMEDTFGQRGENFSSKLSVRPFVSTGWVIRDDNYFSNKEYDDLLTSSLEIQRLEPSSEEPADSLEERHWDAFIEGEDDYFAKAARLDSEHSRQIERSQTCQIPVRNILFLKTHYTGSDVITNILNRFADLRDLLVALPTDGLSSFYWPKKFHWRYMDLRRLHGELPNLLCSHARYDPEVMGKFMPFNTRYISIVRNPIDHFVSVFQKLDIETRMDIHSTKAVEEFVSKPKWYLKKAMKEIRFLDSMNLLKNGMFFDLGLHTSDYNHEIAISSAIFDLQKKFTLILIHEYLDESLVLIKRKFCWDIDDVIYLSSAFPREPSTGQALSSNARNAILKWNMADVMLYEFFNATLWENIRNEKNFDSEVAALKARRKKVEELCRGDDGRKSTEGFSFVNINTTEDSGKRIEPETVCRKMAMSEVDYLEYFRKKY